MCPKYDFIEKLFHFQWEKFAYMHWKWLSSKVFLLSGIINAELYFILSQRMVQRKKRWWDSSLNMDVCVQDLKRKLYRYPCFSISMIMMMMMLWNELYIEMISPKVMLIELLLLWKNIEKLHNSWNCNKRQISR